MADTDPFKPLSHHELDRLSSDEIATYITAAVAAGRREAAQPGLDVLCMRHTDDVRRRLRGRVPENDLDDVTSEVMLSAVTTLLKGRRPDSFGAVLTTIINFRRADLFRYRGRRPEQEPLPEEHREAEDIFGPDAAVADATGAVDVQSVIDACLEGLSEAHRLVVELAIFEDLPSREVAEQVDEELGDRLETPMSEDNVNKIKSRFRDCVRKLLEDGDQP